LEIVSAVQEPFGKYFIEKTPRNAIYAPLVMHIFSNSKFIFLWRNPLAIISSLVETYGKGSWNIHRYTVDLYRGLEAMISAYVENTSRTFSLRYEDLVTNPEDELKRISKYLKVDFNPDMLHKFSQIELIGSMGDKIGPNTFDIISNKPLNKWIDVLSCPLRKSWCKKYLKWIGKERLNLMGYDIDTLIDEFECIPNTFINVPSDALRMLYGRLDSIFDISHLRDKLTRARKSGRLYRSV
jgi:hypothetical protein